ncbi:hypothetical protein A3H16_03880 [Candidatus Kaiserbacteria bacterium RIFCSPLOWO2_12_FULL_53_8]|uniref:Uncharacterized protein n=2 Tax=Candidatus Kaiseribacteriota TaxID=1752734 RepID=A0A1F6CUJ9_9BACT|nr:MAG: hypothetical protein A2851_04685 [Candidatus Kaiserbacteria bacterium RIFCSPHIGHO2_01_FULL_53_29]OGG90837.1 MAG: hypothetical protein A3H16_03880 [Candidatus Kaiserbacteria bacterium RIFCSPLOWO2_12_FULL_53_8]
MSPKLKRYLFHFAQNFALVVIAGMAAWGVARPTYDFFYCTYVGPVLDSYACQGLSHDFGYEILGWMIMLYSFFVPLFLAALGSSARYRWIAVALSPMPLLIVVGLITGADPTIVGFGFFLGIMVLIGLGLGRFARKTLGKMPSLEAMKKYF